MVNTMSSRSSPASICCTRREYVFHRIHFGFGGGGIFWPIVVSAELAVETRKVVVRLIHWPDALDIIAEPIAMTAGKETATTVELGNPAAAIHTVGANIADEPRSLTAEATRGPADRHALFNRLPFAGRTT